jgi:hypothetical protein
MGAGKESVGLADLPEQVAARARHCWQSMGFVVG